MNEYCIELDVNNICRVCIQNNVQLKQISQFDIIDGEILSFISIFELFFNLKIDKTDGLPQKICVECKKILIDVFILRKKCLKHDLLLRKILKIPAAENTNKNLIKNEDLNEEKHRINSSTNVIIMPSSDIVCNDDELTVTTTNLSKELIVASSDEVIPNDEVVANEEVATGDEVVTSDVIIATCDVPIICDPRKTINTPDNNSIDQSNDNQLLQTNTLNDKEILTSNNKSVEIIDEDLAVTSLIEEDSDNPTIKHIENEVTITEGIADVDRKSNIFFIVNTHDVENVEEDYDEEAANIDYISNDDEEDDVDDNNENYSIGKYVNAIEMSNEYTNYGSLKKDADTIIKNEQIYNDVDYLDYECIDDSESNDDDYDDNEDLYTILKVTDDDDDDDNTNDYYDHKTDQIINHGNKNNKLKKSLIRKGNDNIFNFTNDKRIKIDNRLIGEFIQCKLCELKIKPNRLTIHNRMHNEILTNIFYNTKFYRCGLCHMVFIHLNEFKEHIISSSDNCRTPPLTTIDDAINLHSSDDDNIIDDQSSQNFIDNTRHSILNVNSIKLYSISKFRISDNIFDEYDNDDGDDPDDDNHLQNNVIQCDYCSQLFITSTFSNIVNCIDSLTIHYDKEHFQINHNDNDANSNNNNNNNILDNDNAIADENEKNNRNHQQLNAIPIPIEYISTFKKQHRCNLCKNPFNTLQSVIYHIYQHFDIYHCPLFTCGLCYPTFKKLSRHFEVQHSQFDRHTCEYCKEEFDKYYKLKIHLRNDCVKREIQCDVCSKRFFTKATYRLHMQIHSDVKAHKCDVCYKEFVHRSDYETHYRTHTGEKPFKCAICEMGFRSNGNLTDHMSTHEVQKKFKCDECDKMFISSRTLRSHINVHRGIHKYRCNVCDKGFLRRYHLTSHLRIHNKVKTMNQRRQKKSKKQSSGDGIPIAISKD